MTANQIVDIVLNDLESFPDMSKMSFVEKVFCIGIYRVYKLYYSGTISKDTGMKLKQGFTKEFECWQLNEEIFNQSIQAKKDACHAGVRLTKLLNSGASDSEVLDAALDVLNVSGLSGGIPWERSKE